MSHETYNARQRKKYFSTRFSLSATASNFDVDASYALFKSDDQFSPRFDPVRGLDLGLRYNIRIVPEVHPVILRYNSTANDPIYLTNDVVFEDFNIQARNIYLTPADQVTAAVDRWVAAAELSGNYAGVYFKLFAVDPTSYKITTYGIWFKDNSIGTQPVDSTVNIFVPVTVATADSATTIGGNTATAINAIAGTPFAAVNTTGTVNITHSTSGAAPGISNVNTPGTFSTPTAGAGNATTVQVLVR